MSSEVSRNWRSYQDKGVLVRKIINDPEHFVDEMIGGVLAAFPDHFRSVGTGIRGLVRADAPIMGKVALCTGGGSGHLPLFLGYVGPGLLDGVAIGNVFSSPAADEMLEVAKACDGGNGIVFLYGNYSGDVMNFDMAAEMAEMEGINVISLTAKDDVSSAPAEESERRRAIAGIFFPYKIAGAAAATGRDVTAVVQVTERAIGQTASMGVALSGTTIPSVGKPGFSIPEGEMEVGMGIHGEPGVERGLLATADEITSTLLQHVLDDLKPSRGDSVAVLVNTLGATAPEEAYLLMGKAHELLRDSGVSVAVSYAGEFATSMEMAGASISLLLLDDDLEELLRAPAYSPLLSQQVGSRHRA